MSLKTIQRIYTDGACSGNPGPGGWGTVVYFTDGSVHELGGSAAQTTNNRMELQAAIAALDFLIPFDQAEPVTLYTDSEYVKNGITQWVQGWKKKGWKTSTGKPVLNQDLWQLLDQLNHQAIAKAGLQWKYVRGHSGDVGNDRCDEIARTFSSGRTPALRQARLSTPKTLDGDDASKNQPNEPSASQLSGAPAASTTDNLAKNSFFDANATDATAPKAVQSVDEIDAAPLDSSAMVDSTTPIDVSDLPREVRVAQLRNLVETLHMADEIARQGYLISSSELADLMDVNASAVTSRGDNWVWRNWVVSRVRREGNQILWQLERVD
jgi:ribonuclease HI